jgi:hypothetical protein
MRAAIFHEPRRIEAGDRPDPSLREPTGAIIRVLIACVCGSASSSSPRLPSATGRVRTAGTAHDRLHERRLLPHERRRRQGEAVRRAIKSLVRVGTV